jgi:hypothetical protein
MEKSAGFPPSTVARAMKLPATSAAMANAVTFPGWGSLDRNFMKLSAPRR